MPGYFIGSTTFNINAVSDKYFCGTSPCNSCPYRKDVKLQHWSIDEFADLLANEESILGSTYLCHKKNGTACKGWLIDQDKRNFPSIALRMALVKASIGRKYLDKLKSKFPLYNSVREMIKANYPELLK